MFYTSARIELRKKMKDQNQSTYWQETGRWGGYEECLDPQSGVWASSHISYLTFKSLIQLRRTMNTGQWGWWHRRKLTLGWRFLSYLDLSGHQANVLSFISCNSKRHTALCNLPTGVMIFDCEETTLESIAERMVSEMVSKKELRPNDKDGVLKSFLQSPRYPPTQQPDRHHERGHVCHVAEMEESSWSFTYFCMFLNVVEKLWVHIRFGIY